ncbi:MAG: beta-ketoacyl-ACP synthase III [Holosporales bacterium]
MTKATERRALIVGVGGYLPERIVTNHDLEKVMETSHEWIVERTGIEKRHFVDDNQATSDLATAAAERALAMAGMTGADIDMIVVGTATPDEVFPSVATMVQARIGNTHGFAFDVAGACAGYVVALATANNFIRTGAVKTALVIGAETISRLLDQNDRKTFVLFGDGAGAVVLKGVEPEDNPEDRGILDIRLYSDGRHHDILHASGGPSSTGTIGTIHMEGQEVFKHAVTKLGQAAQIILGDHQLTANDIDWLIPHQANQRIIDAVAQRVNLPAEKVVSTVNQHANTSAASIPLALSVAVADGRVKQGDLILHETIGGGLIWGSALVRF